MYMYEYRVLSCSIATEIRCVSRGRNAGTCLDAQALRDQAVRRSIGWRSAMLDAEVEARLARRQVEEIVLQEEELHEAIDTQMTDVK